MALHVPLPAPPNCPTGGSMVATATAHVSKTTKARTVVAGMANSTGCTIICQWCCRLGGVAELYGQGAGATVQ